MADIYKYTLEQLDKLEENTVLSQFTSEDAWKLGSLARKLAIEKYPHKAIVIDITLNGGQVLFHSVVNAGTAIDNDEWINRKKNTVLRIGKSSFYVGQKLRLKEKSIEDGLFISSKDYAAHGGSVPMKIKGFDGIIGALTISGLAQEQDHLLSIEALEKYSS
ncbi:hypothetical protein HYPBUDRAFT_115874 [Hyphopichia burtonii NRRL Y-1933]|uniref:DUF336-domain-containing protein n=1 Tax=Hyphopichia burtonii NRRL Y-1933 TaxID=984485 RepID=A0A1E4RBJ6_9ASCO|nr:hypothetical protein HYPBUDRAFT_115874 [Hyphopichia burtonii NRRL Y-1933]ODV64606.1 hypothetical protein HYPBUDRAFT_115874 [Hyphopichia burtonii NRRL Y-1933]